MDNTLKTVGSWDFCLFVIGLISTPLCGAIQTCISECDPFVFECTCMIMLYIVMHRAIDFK